MIKHRMTALLAALSILALAACGAKPAPTVSMHDLRENMLSAAPSLPEMKTVSDESADAEALFAYLSDMDYGKVERFFLAYSATGLADEIAVIAVRDPGDAEAALASLSAHLESRAQLYTQYAPAQVPRVENAELFVRDQYAVLIVCDDPGAVKDAFIAFTTEG